MPDPCVLFVCVKNAGKSQMAAALLRQLAPGRVEVHSAGTRPGGTLNELSRQVVEEVGASLAGEWPKAVDPDLLRRADRVIVVGSDARLDPVDGMRAPITTWELDEPSARGIDGIERMRLVRDDLNDRVRSLLAGLDQGLPESR
ncbi:low molecular weight phosphatase family protein [Allobranchiibius sp. CTAmp26]|uniref:arsenate-mycothiol transferase ArsC n=1 Tax=Allobranchiibius sp. CTAmp26 TaxID=2815214 RepID=UPI001AA198C0|nr:low molecular weight phosphatase family protein [Allobranchiibius sp. CTAmp26]MBO1756703.1 low molecular weight phosphatase family protein [Allobranchiibius sp. CTAmp26]